VVLDSGSGKRNASFSMCEDLSATVFNPDEDLLINSCSEGGLSFVPEDSPNQYSAAGTVKMSGRVLAMAFDQTSKTIFVTTGEVESAKSVDHDSGHQLARVPSAFWSSVGESCAEERRWRGECLSLF
jgi:hypothetical protein